MRELTELVDYVTINLCQDISSSGIQQYYKSPNALEKLLLQANKARVNELGKVAAIDYEKHISKTEGDPDYSTSIKRMYTRTAVISSLKPMMIMVEIDPNQAGF